MGSEPLWPSLPHALPLKKKQPWSEEDKVNHRHDEEGALLTSPFHQGDIIQFRGASQCHTVASSEFQEQQCWGDTEAQHVRVLGNKRKGLVLVQEAVISCSPPQNRIEYLRNRLSSTSSKMESPFRLW